MTKQTEDGRLKHYTEIERQNAPEGSHPASKALRSRPATRSETNSRVREFSRIERGQEA